MFYRQQYVPPTIDGMSSVGADRAGVHLVGGEVGLHYDPDGSLWLVAGSQFEDVLNVSVPNINQATEAYSAAQSSAQDWPGFSAANPLDITETSAASDISSARLSLYSTGDGRTFRYVWKVPIRDSSASPFIANLDAETGSLLSVVDPTTWSACEPDTPYQDGGFGTAQNSESGTRVIWATELDDPGTYTHEAHKNATASIPDIQIFYGTDGGDACDSDDAKYALLQTESYMGFATYPTTDIGKSATDAMYFTYKTMETFHDHGRDGWDDTRKDALVVVEVEDCTQGYYGESYFNHESYYDEMPSEEVGQERVPLPGVGICPPDEGDYTAAAALDVIAHEFGHGIVYTTADWDRSDWEGRVYHEAWADVIGHAVEWDNQSAGDDFEKADWRFGEDIDPDFNDDKRRHDWDYDEGETGLYKFHAADDYYSTWEYRHAHPLSVAFSLMADGDQPEPEPPDPSNDHKNPWCRINDENQDCDVTVTDIGVIPATRIMFRTLTYYLTEDSEWDDFGFGAQAAAWVLYKSCPGYNAATQQTAVREAFDAIGYPSTWQGLIPCIP